jgi:hypothetical protein
MNAVNGIGQMGAMVSVDLALTYGPGMVAKAVSKVPQPSALTKSSSKAVQSLAKYVNSASMRRMRIPNRMVQETVDRYIAETTKLFEASGGKFIIGGPRPSPRVLGRMTPGEKLIHLYDGHDIQDLVEELGHFRQSVRDGYYGVKGGIPQATRDLWEAQIDILFSNLGMVPR